MKDRDFILTIISRGHGYDGFGRTSVQKVAYLLGLRERRDLGFGAHFYGPFSEHVNDQLKALVVSELVEERTESLPFTGPSGFQARRYRYGLTDIGRARVSQLAEQYPKESKTIEAEVEQLASATEGLQARWLAPACKALFLEIQEARPLSGEEVGKLVMNVGWDITGGQVESSVKMLEKLGYFGAAGRLPVVARDRAPRLKGGTLMADLTIEEALQEAKTALMSETYEVLESRLRQWQEGPWVSPSEYKNVSQAYALLKDVLADVQAERDELTEHLRELEAALVEIRGLRAEYDETNLKIKDPHLEDA